MAGGNISAQRHFEDTIQRKRSLSEVRRFLPAQEIENLENIYHGSDFIVWGAVPGPMNESRWEKMTPGDVVLIYNNGRICFAGEIAAKVRNPELARYFWREDESGSTWELMYFIVNEEKTDVQIEKLNPLFGYDVGYRPQGFSRVNDDAVRMRGIFDWRDNVIRRGNVAAQNLVVAQDRARIRGYSLWQRGY